MAAPVAKPWLCHVPGMGWQKRAILQDPSGTERCQFLGNIPYASSTPKRFERATPVENADYQFGPSQASAKDWSDASENSCPQPGARVKNMSEDCQRLDIYLPLEDGGGAPEEGWPVFIFIHGGYLQWGSNHQAEPSNLLAPDSPFKAIVVMPNYRLNAFGFLCSKELLDESMQNGDAAGNLNLGFRDQRLSIEWCHRFIHLYGGNRENITLGGLSAGAYSTFHQLAYEVALPDDLAVIKRVVMFSNGCGLQPKAPREVQAHWEELLKALSIPLDLSGPEKLKRLRSLPASDLVSAVDRVPENAFRAVTDGTFVRPTLFQELQDRSFAEVLLRRDVRIMIGECRDEVNSYRLTSPPKKLSELQSRLAVEYPTHYANRIAEMYLSGQSQPCDAECVQSLFGKAYSDLQVHTSERGLLDALHPILTAGNSQILRYRIEWQTQSSRQLNGDHMGVCHGSDYTIWFRGNGAGEISQQEDEKIRRFAIEPLVLFVNGDYAKIDWGTKSIDQVRQLCDDGSTQIVTDQTWQRRIREWTKIQQPGNSRTSKL